MVMMGSSESGLDPNSNPNDEDEQQNTNTTGTGTMNFDSGEVVVGDGMAENITTTTTNSAAEVVEDTTTSNTNANLTSSPKTRSKTQDEIRSQLQIQIGPNGGTTISASRRKNQKSNAKNENSSIEQMTKDLIAAQLERKEKLVRALMTEQSRVHKLRAEIGLLRSKLHPFPNLERLKDENQRLRIECDLMTREVDLYDNGSVPLGELNPEFYRNINPGQDANALLLNANATSPKAATAATGRRPTGSRISGPAPPPRPPPPRYLPIPKVDSPTGEWCCTVCTFQNHPQLSHCEQCDMIRVKPSPATSPGFPRI